MLRRFRTLFVCGCAASALLCLPEKVDAQRMTFPEWHGGYVVRSPPPHHWGRRYYWTGHRWVYHPRPVRRVWGPTWRRPVRSVRIGPFSYTRWH